MRTRPLLRSVSTHLMMATLFSVFCALALVSTALAAKQLYTCGMHPQIIREEPGNCPICGMQLQPVRANSATTAAATGERKLKYYKSTMIAGQVSEKPGKDTMGMDMVPVYEGDDTGSNAIRIDAGTVQRMNLKTALVKRGPVRREFRTVGTVVFNEESYRDITTKYEGWFEKLYVNATWAAVKEGDPLFEIYSPELYNAELNYLVARRSEGDAAGVLTRAAKARLQLLDLPAEEIAALDRTGEVPRTRTFRAPSAGIIVEKMGVAGQMMKPGERIYRMADLATVWVEAQIYESDLPFVQEGQTATVRTTYGAERMFTGTVDRLLPQVEAQTRSVSARIVLPNADGYLRPGMFTDVKFVTQLADSAVLVPDLAVLRSGERNTVFVALGGGSFEPREVTLGNRSEGGNYEVLSGLSVGELIVTSGQFMLDSESQLREAIQKMLKRDSAKAAPTITDAPTAPAEMSPAGRHSGHETAAPTEPLYTCPMDAHADVVTDQPGNCPKCGMTLVPTTESDHGKQSEELWHRQHSDAAEPAHKHGG